MRHTKIAVLCVALGAAAVPALAWGPDGHQTIGAIADQLIAGTHAGTEVAAILGGLSLRQASVWADCAKGVDTSARDYPYAPRFHDPACKVHETPDGIEAMRDYVRRNDKNCVLAPGDEETCHKVYHYADVAIQHSAYQRGLVGTSDHDVTAAIAACVAVLKGDPAPAPFSIKDKREALLLLTHFAGDVHQPLHVGAVYLNSKGRRVNPDSGTYDPQTKTDGGNALHVGSKKLHGMWDAVPPSLTPSRLTDNMVARARTVPVTSGPVEGWSQDWASESVVVAQKEFRNVAFKAKSAGGSWPTTLPANYAGTMDDTKDGQIVTAGARLAQTLQAIWP